MSAPESRTGPEVGSRTGLPLPDPPYQGWPVTELCTADAYGKVIFSYINIFKKFHIEKCACFCYHHKTKISILKNNNWEMITHLEVRTRESPKSNCKRILWEEQTTALQKIYMYREDFLNERAWKVKEFRLKMNKDDAKEESSKLKTKGQGRRARCCWHGE